MKRRSPSLTVFLAAICIGLGHMYNGRLIRGIAILGVAQIIITIGIFGALEFFTGAILFILTALGIWLFNIYDSWRLSKTAQEFELKKYNRWYFYLLYIIINSLITDVNQVLIGPGYKPYKIPTGTMIPTIAMGDHVMVDQRIYGTEEIQRGDVVVFPYPEKPETTFIKRVIGLGGETIEIKNDVVLINHSPIEEPYALFDSELAKTISIRSRLRNMGPILIPENKLFVMGDNRYNSNDSRLWGFLDANTVTGKALYIYWSHDPLSGYFGGYQLERIGLDIK